MCIPALELGPGFQGRKGSSSCTPSHLQPCHLQITADYATYSVHNMHEFQCMCGAARCRGLVRGTDYLEPWVDTLYGEHVSEYVALKRAQAQALAAADPKKP